MNCLIVNINGISKVQVNRFATLKSSIYIQTMNELILLPGNLILLTDPLLFTFSKYFSILSESMLH